MGGSLKVKIPVNDRIIQKSKAGGSRVNIPAVYPRNPSIRHRYLAQSNTFLKLCLHVASQPYLNVASGSENVTYICIRVLRFSNGVCGRRDRSVTSALVKTHQHWPWPRKSTRRSTYHREGSADGRRRRGHLSPVLLQEPVTSRLIHDPRVWHYGS